MGLRNWIQKLYRIVVHPLFINDRGKRSTASLTFSLLLLFLAFAILLGVSIFRQLEFEIKGLVTAEVLLAVALLLTWRGQYIITNHLVPFGLLIITIYMMFTSQKYQEMIILGFPVIIALAGVLLGKLGTLTYALLTVSSVHAIYLLDLLSHNNGHRGFELLRLLPYGDILVFSIFIGLITSLIYYANNNYSRSLEASRISEIGLRQTKKDLEKYAHTLEVRTEQLLTGAKVSRAASSILDPDELAQQVVDMVCTRFALYYVGLFLVDRNMDLAVLHAATGEAGKIMLSNKHSLKVGSTSMIGWCISNQKARIALDVGKDAVRFDNPLLPMTHSELALPLISSGKIIGGLTIQSTGAAAFSEEDIASFQAMADQLAIAISNATNYSQLQSELKERKRVEQEIRRLNTELEQRVAERTKELQAANENLTTLSQLKDEFVANVSHELRTPITSIMLYHSLIEARPADTPRYVKHLKRETDRLARLIEDLLFISRLEQGRTSYVPSPLNINRLVHDYILDRTPLASQHQLSLFMEPAGDLPEINADEKMIGQVLSILLTNAMNYTPSGGTIKIKTSSSHHDQRAWVGFSVTDDGPGILPLEQEHIFERFFRGKAGHDSQTAGTGLGLSIARTIIEKHDGQIHVTSPGEHGEGTTFHVWLPANITVLAGI